MPNNIERKFIYLRISERERPCQLLLIRPRIKERMIKTDFSMAATHCFKVECCPTLPVEGAAATW